MISFLHYCFQSSNTYFLHCEHTDFFLSTEFLDKQGVSQMRINCNQLLSGTTLLLHCKSKTLGAVNLLTFESSLPLPAPCNQTEVYLQPGAVKEILRL